VGEEKFRQELLEQVRSRVGPNHDRGQRRESTEEKAEGIVQGELRKMGWQEEALSQRPKGDAGKVRIARRLRRETTMTLAWIAQRLAMGTAGHISNRLCRVKSLVGQGELFK
jgi:hypothetical protein